MLTFVKIPGSCFVPERQEVLKGRWEPIGRKQKQCKSLYDTNVRIFEYKKCTERDTNTLIFFFFKNLCVHSDTERILGPGENTRICCFLLLSKPGGLVPNKSLLRGVHSGAICGLLAVPPSNTAKVVGAVTVAAIRIRGCDNIRGVSLGAAAQRPQDKEVLTASPSKPL